MMSVLETLDTEVPAKARRRRLMAEYKQAILRKADCCRRPGKIGAMLRREGRYSSHLVASRTARTKGEPRELTAKRRKTNRRSAT